MSGTDTTLVDIDDFVVYQASSIDSLPPDPVGNINIAGINPNSLSLNGAGT